MTERTRIRVSSRALGERRYVKVWVYESLDDMRRHATEFNGNDHSNSLGLVQAWLDERRRTSAVIVRLWRGELGLEVVSHEIHHAATAIYGAHVGDRINRTAHLTSHNEPFAYLYSDLFGSLVGRLNALGYYR